MQRATLGSWLVRARPSVSSGRARIGEGHRTTLRDFAKAMWQAVGGGVRPEFGKATLKKEKRSRKRCAEHQEL